MDAQLILKEFETNESLNSLFLSEKFDKPHQDVVGAIMKLDANENLLKLENLSKDVITLTEEGENVANSGSNEYIFMLELSKHLKKLNVSSTPFNSEFTDPLPKPVSSIGFTKAMSNGWCLLKNENNAKQIIIKKMPEQDSLKMRLTEIKNDPNIKMADKELNDLKKRKLITKTTIKYFNIKKGPNFRFDLATFENDLTESLLVKDKYKTVQFKNYNFNSLGLEVKNGGLHPLLEMRSEFKRLFLNMGFIEMKTNRYIESSFWNFDALFQPQKHSARDAHDTFFIKDNKDPTKIMLSKLNDVDKDYLNRVKNTHENGGDTNSTGFQSEWQITEAQKLILRTHTTAVSAKLLYELSQKMKANPKFKLDKPLKYFSIDRVFRNETTDATHLAEFHQIEGVVVGENLSLKDLMATLSQFYAQLNIQKIKFKPAYNPYTEPSMEIFSYHEGLKKWVEIGNSGVFRPEMLLPMGLPSNISVIAWGLSLERPTMIKYGINNIRSLLGNKIDMNMVKAASVCVI